MHQKRRWREVTGKNYEEKDKRERGRIAKWERKVERIGEGYS